MLDAEALGKEIREGKSITRQEAMELYSQPLEKLCRTADAIRRRFCSDRFDLCSILNAKSGRCPENCRFCAQSSHNRTQTPEYPLLSTEEIVKQATIDEAQGILRYSIVTSGKRLSDQEVESMCETIRAIREKTGLSVCVSFGLLHEGQYQKLKAAGVSRIHNNLETSRRYFPNICTTHTFDEKIQAIRAAQAAGLSVCSGGIMGLGETWEDRIDMAFTLRELGIKSVPVNMLNPLAGTPLEQNQTLAQEDMRRIVAVYRFILPGASIRLAGGRGLLPDKGKSCFLSGANAAISGNMLTTAGITVPADMQMIKHLGYTLGYDDEKPHGNQPEQKTACP